MDARIHGLEKEVDDVKKVKVEVAASEGAPIQCSRERPWFEPCPRSSGWLVPSPAESELISAAVEPAAGSVELAAAQDGARLAHAALLLLRADMPPKGLDLPSDRPAAWT